MNVDDAGDDEPAAGNVSGRAAAAIASQRIDKWLWFARVAKTRKLAATLVAEGKIRVNGVRLDKPGATVQLGDVVTVLMRQRVRILKIAGFAALRGDPAIAANLFEDLSPRPQPAAPGALPVQTARRAR